MTGSGPLLAGDRVRCVGELLTDVVAHLPEQLAVASDTRASVRLTGGGAAANTAAWLAELGVPVALAARVGDDAAGRALIDDLGAPGGRGRRHRDRSGRAHGCLPGAGRHAR